MKIILTIAVVFIISILCAVWWVNYKSARIFAVPPVTTEKYKQDTETLPKVPLCRKDEVMADSEGFPDRESSCICEGETEIIGSRLICKEPKG